MQNQGLKKSQWSSFLLSRLQHDCNGDLQKTLFNVDVEDSCYSPEVITRNYFETKINFRYKLRFVL